MNRQKELEICLCDISRMVVIPSATNMHFSQLCTAQSMARECLNDDEKYKDVVTEFKSKNERIEGLEDALERSLLNMVALAEYANDELDEEQHKSVFDDINKLRKVLLKEWDT